MPERKLERNIDKRLKKVEEQAESLLNSISNLSEEEIKEEFSPIWKSLQELIFDIDFRLEDLDDRAKREYIEKISKLSINLSQGVLTYVSGTRLRYLIIHVFLDWIRKEARRWDIELPKVELPKPPEQLPKPKETGTLKLALEELVKTKALEQLISFVTPTFFVRISPPKNLYESLKERLELQKIEDPIFEPIKIPEQYSVIPEEKEKGYYTKKQSMLIYEKGEKHLLSGGMYT